MRKYITVLFVLMIVLGSMGSIAVFAEDNATKALGEGYSVQATDGEQVYIATDGSYGGYFNAYTTIAVADMELNNLKRVFTANDGQCVRIMGARDGYVFFEMGDGFEIMNVGGLYSYDTKKDKLYNITDSVTDALKIFGDKIFIYNTVMGDVAGVSLYCANFDGSNKRRMTENSYGDVWRKDDRIYVVEPVGADFGSTRIFSYSLDGKDKQSTDEEESNMTESISSNGNDYYSYSYEDYVINMNGEAISQLPDNNYASLCVIDGILYYVNSEWFEPDTNGDVLYSRQIAKRVTPEKTSFFKSNSIFNFIKSLFEKLNPFGFLGELFS